MDIITLNKIISNFGSSTSCVFDSSFLDEEIEELVRLNIIEEIDTGKYRLRKSDLYQYAKSISYEGNYVTAIAIFKYLIDVLEKNTKDTKATLNYQLFKNYFYNKEYYKSYEAFKEGFDQNCELYPLILNMFDYILKKKHECMVENNQLLSHFVNKEFSQVKEYFQKHDVKARESQKKVFGIINDKAIMIEKDIDNKVKEYINNNDLSNLSRYIRDLDFSHQSNNSLQFISSIADLYLLFKADKVVDKDSTKKFFDILNLYMENNIDKVLKEYDISTKYKSCLYRLLKGIVIELSKTKYHSYFIKYAKREINNINKKDSIIVIDNLAGYDDVLKLEIAKSKEDVIVNTIINGNNKKIVITKANPEDIEFNATEINELFRNEDYQKCISYCLKYISKYPYDNIDVYNKLICCYKHFGNKEEAAKYEQLRDLLFIENDNYLTIKDDALFYGINCIDEIIDFLSKYNLPVEIACINFGLCNSQIEIVKMLLAKYYYSVGNKHNGSLYYYGVVDNGTNDPIIDYMKDEIGDVNHYNNVDYYNARQVIKKLELKK